MYKICAFLLGIVALFCLYPLPAAEAQQAVPVQNSEDFVLGKSTAPITIFEYASYSCPHCADFYQRTLPQIKKDWIDAGKARLIYRDFPLNLPALHASLLVHCAPPDEYYAFVDLVFANQDNWVGAGAGAGPDALDKTDQALGKLGVLGGVSPEKFKSCLDDKAMADKILNGRIAANKDYGIESTPTFFINGRKLQGALPYDDFNKALNEALPKS